MNAEINRVQRAKYVCRAEMLRCRKIPKIEGEPESKRTKNCKSQAKTDNTENAKVSFYKAF